MGSLKYAVKFWNSGEMHQYSIEQIKAKFGVNAVRAYVCRHANVCARACVPVRLKAREGGRVPVR